MTTYRVADRRRWTSVSNAAIEDETLSFRARGLLVWLLSKPDTWTVKAEAIVGAGVEGRDAIRSALAELEAAGYIHRQRVQDPATGFWSSTCEIHETPKTDSQASVARPSVSQASSTNNGELDTEQQSSSLRSEEELIAETRVDTHTPTAVAQAYWEWHVADRGKTPTQDFKALMAVTRALLKRGYESDQIVDAMKTTKVMTAKAVSDEAAEQKHKHDETPNTQRIPAAIVRAFAKAEPWFLRRCIMQKQTEKAHWMRLCASQVNFGYGPGETMLRMAVALRTNNATTFALADAKVERFNGELADYPDAMERAYVNQAWSAR